MGPSGPQGGEGMLATFVIFLREGVEASMIVSILLAYLDRSGQRRHFRDVFLGVGAAALLAAGGGVAAYLTIRHYSGSRVQTIFETCTFGLAAVLLTWMTFWMRAHARSMGSELRGRAEEALAKRQRLGIGLLAFQAVGREGIESAVFTLAIVFATGARGTIWGALAGVSLSLAVAFFIYRLGRRVNVSVFFTALGSVLMVFAAGLVADTVQNLQQLGWVPVLTHQLWNTSGVLAEGSAGGDVFHSLLGYSDRPTVLQAIAYVSYVALALGAFLHLSRRRVQRADAPAGATGAGLPAGSVAP